jgi:hypothetical protein
VPTDRSTLTTPVDFEKFEVLFEDDEDDPAAD